MYLLIYFPSQNTYSIINDSIDKLRTSKQAIIRDDKVRAWIKGDILFRHACKRECVAFGRQKFGTEKIDSATTDDDDDAPNDHNFDVHRQQGTTQQQQQQEKQQQQQTQFEQQQSIEFVEETTKPERPPEQSSTDTKTSGKRSQYQLRHDRYMRSQSAKLFSMGPRKSLTNLSTVNCKQQRMPQQSTTKNHRTTLPSSLSPSGETSAKRASSSASTPTSAKKAETKANKRGFAPRPPTTYLPSASSVPVLPQIPRNTGVKRKRTASRRESSSSCSTTTSKTENVTYSDDDELIMKYDDTMPSMTVYKSNVVVLTVTDDDDDGDDEGDNITDRSPAKSSCAQDVPFFEPWSISRADMEPPLARDDACLSKEFTNDVGKLRLAVLSARLGPYEVQASSSGHHVAELIFTMNGSIVYKQHCDDDGETVSPLELELSVDELAFCAIFMQEAKQQHMLAVCVASDKALHIRRALRAHSTCDKASDDDDDDAKNTVMHLAFRLEATSSESKLAATKRYLHKFCHYMSAIVDTQILRTRYCFLTLKGAQKLLVTLFSDDETKPTRSLRDNVVVSKSKLDHNFTPAAASSASEMATTVCKSCESVNSLVTVSQIVQQCKSCHKKFIV